MTADVPPEPAGSWRVGDIEIVAVPELVLDESTGPWLMPDLTTEEIATAGLAPDHLTGTGAIRLDSHSYAMRIDGRAIVVDTGVGNAKTRDNPAWHGLDTDYLNELRRAGFEPTEVDLVVITHLHTDHVGWNTTWDGAAWVPTFPNARYVMPAREWRYWRDVEVEPARAAMFADSVTPVYDAGLIDLVDVDDPGLELEAGLSLRPAPGHTPGQVVVEVASEGQQALITGDVIHHPIQVARPEVVTRADVDPGQTIATRRRLLSDLAAGGALVLGTHFPGRSGGRVEETVGGYRFRPLDEEDHRAGRRQHHEGAELPQPGSVHPA